MNVGTVAAGDWPSSVPARARLGVRVGFPGRWTPDEAFDRVRSAVLGVPAVAYGPRSRNIHGTDEAVELATIVSGARTMARFIAGFFMSGDLR